MEDSKENMNNYFLKRSGTSGISGQLYETKLLTLILLRALYDANSEEFVLGTNIEGIGALDDIVFRYKSKDKQKTKILFLQAKHRDDPSKDRLAVEDIFKQSDDFCLHKYLESFLKIKQKLLIDSNNLMFRGPMTDIECEYIIYTSAKENFNKKKILHNSHEENYIKTKEDGVVFQFQYSDEDVERLVTTFTKSRIETLAKAIVKMIIKGNWNNIMTNDCIKMYHVFLAHNVITVETTTKISVHNTQCTGKFQESFLASDDENSLLIKRVLCKQIAGANGIASVYQEDEVDRILKPLRFKLPVDFGNLYFRFYGEKKKQQRKLDYLCLLFEKLLTNISHQDSKHTFIELDDNSIGKNGILQIKDLERYRLGGLVGNLLINDQETEMLKFNLDEQNLSKDNIKILKQLKRKYDLKKFRLDINIDGFPKLKLNSMKHDRKIVINFLNKLKFYTNQAKEDDVEFVIKEEINKLFTVQEKQQHGMFYEKCDAMYLHVHDEVLKWWKQSNSAPYFTNTCQLYQQAIQEIFNRPLINMISYTFRRKINSSRIEFETDAIDCLRLNLFLNSDENYMIIISNEVYFSCVKVIQYFETMRNDNHCIFIDLDFIFNNGLGLAKIGVESLVIPVLVVINRKLDIINFLESINIIRNIFNGKIIILTHQKLERDLNSLCFQIIHKDTNNNFSNLSNKIRRIILDERKIIFQGLEITINTALDKISLDLISPTLLRKIINNDPIEVGQKLIKSRYNKTVDYFINRNICRYITLNIDVDKFISQSKQDIISTSECFSTFEEICKNNSAANAHWFIKKPGHRNMIWKMSHGSLQNIFQYINRATHKDFTFPARTLKDVQEKVVIISSKPGMGKSTLLDHLAVNMKIEHPNLWILYVNLLDHAEQIKQWKTNNTNINLKEVMIFLYSSIHNKDCKYSDFVKENISELDIANTVITLPDIGLLDVDLSEVKLLNHFYNNDNLAILFDGFDEICPDYSDEVIQLLFTLKTSKVVNLWVTSRLCNFLNQLESALETFSFNLQPFTITEQKLFLQNVWSGKLDLDRTLDTLYGTYVDRFFSAICYNLNDSKGQFTNVPLHLYMIAEIYQKLFKDYVELTIRKPSGQFMKEVMDSFNLITLYEKFCDIKFFNIQFEERRQAFNFSDPHFRVIADRAHKVFKDIHKQIAAYLLLDRSVVFSEHDLINVHEYIESIRSAEEKTGIIEFIAGDTPKFVHYTFAEYFAVEYIFDKLRCSNNTTTLWKYLIDDIILTDNKHGLRRFIDSKLEKEDHNRLNKTIIDLNRKHMTTVIASLLNQSDLPTNAIHVTAVNKFHNITIFLIECAKTILNQNNLPAFIKLINKTCGKPNYQSMCTFCTAVCIGNSDVVKRLINLITDIDYKRLKNMFHCQDIPKFCPMILAIYHGRSEMFDALEHDPELIVELLVMQLEGGVVPTVSHYLAQRNINLFLNHLSKLNKKQLEKMFSVVDFEGKSPLHYAAKENNYDFFSALDLLLDRQTFKSMCKIVDYNGFTPICTLPYHKQFFDKMKELLKKVYDEYLDIDVEDFLFNKLPKLYPKYTQFNQPLTNIYSSDHNDLTFSG